jgi:hypothetical protein
MTTNLLTHIVPTLPPQAGDAGEYALNLARKLREQCGINSQFILCDPKWDGPARTEDFVIRRLRFPNEAGLWGLLASLKDYPAVLLHYDSFSYHEHGVPAWLYHGIKSWLAERNRGLPPWHSRFFTVFHELGGPLAKPWQGQFYWQLLQKQLIEKLHGLSQISITSTQHRKTLLDAIEPQKTLLLPIPSSLPDVKRPFPRVAGDAPLQAAILGQQAPGPEAVGAHANLLGALDKTNRLAGVMLIGGNSRGAASLNDEMALLQKSVSKKCIKVLDHLTPRDISNCLSRADLFLSAQSGEAACKSGGTMAALAAGCVTILRDGRNTAPLYESEHFIASDDSPSSVKRFERFTMEGKLERIATAGQAWYQRYADWTVVVQKYQEALQSREPVELSELRTNSSLWNLPIPSHTLTPSIIRSPSVSA